MRFSVGDTVVLNTPDNPRLHGASARIRELTGWGAHVVCKAAATGKFRALFGEMELFHKVNGELGAAIECGFTGNVCANCGSLRLKRVGSCETCEDCGSSNGCS